ncbi:MAG TPA: alpha-2-macroglobulin family protein [Anaeromyxobacter sp.]|nr:alpha-2-macroglobulin family protein [Anaeromyxobacter sp.]
MRRATAAVLATLALAGCGEGCSPRSRSGPLELAPLPEPPPLSVAPEALPGAGGEIAVVAARPQGPVEGDVRPTITFTKPVVAMGSVEQEKGLPTPIRVDPPIDGEWRWLGSATTELVPRARVPWGTSFTVTVPGGLRAVDGSTLPEPFTFQFETPRPRVQDVDPEPRWRWLAPRQAIALTFDQPVKDLAASLRLRVGSDAAFPFQVKEVRLADEERAARPRRRPPPWSGEARGQEDRRVRYQIVPGRPMPLDSDVELSVVAPIRGVEGPLPLDGTPSWTFRTHGAFRVTGVEACWWRRGEPCPHGPVRLVTTNRIDAETLAASVSFSPKVELDWRDVTWTSPTEVRLPAAFAPGTRYEVAVSAAARDEFGQPIAAPFEGEFRTDDVPPEYDLGGELALVEAGGDGALPATATNVSRIDVRLVPLDAPALARVLAAEPADAFFEQGVPLAVDTSARRNRSRTAPIPLKAALAERKTTLFALRAEARDVKVEKEWQRSRRVKRVFGQVTDLAVHAKLGATSGLVWVTRLSDGRPVPAARLALHDRTGSVRWTGATDADGLARVPGLASLVPGAEDRWETPFALVSAEAGGDTGVTLSTWAGGLDPSAFDLPTDWDGNVPRSLGRVFAERGIYRPGETAHVKGLLRSRRLGRIATPGGKVLLVVTSARGKKVFEKAVALTAYGTFSAEVPIEADAPLGGYALSATLGEGETRLEVGGSFRVEEYRTPRFQVDVVAPAASISAGDPVKAQVIARYLFGGAMPGAAVRWAVARASIPFEPPGNSGFAFGPLAWGWDDGEPEPTADVAASGSAETGPEGIVAVDAGVAETPAGRTFAYTVEAEVADVDRQRIAGRAEITVHPAAAYAGVRRRASGFAEAGKDDVLEVIAAAPDGARRAGLAVKVEVKRREWRWIRKQGVGGRWHVESEVAEERAGGCDVRTAAGPAECRFRPEKPGFYVAEATLADEKGRRQTTRFPFHAAGPGWVSWQREETDRLDLVPDRKRYEPGDVARVLVKSPFPEAEAVITVEREGVLSARRVRLSGAATTLEVPISEEHVPNVFVSVVLVRGRVAGDASGGADADPGRPQVKVGYARLDVERRSKRLEVALKPDRAERRPRERVTVDVRVTDHRGAGTQAEVTVWAVDEGVLRLTAYEPPDPVELLHPPRGLSVRVGEPLVHLVERRRYGTKGESAGGGGGGDGAGSGFRSRFRTTVLFAPEVVTDASGRARVAFDLPDDLTTYRIMALAVTKGDRAGAGRAKVSVSKRLMALPSLPRVARAGDRFEAGVVVHAPAGGVRDVEVRAEATGVALEGPPVRKVSLDGPKPREVRFAMRAPTPGEAVLRFSVAGGGERDGVEQRIPVRLPVLLEAVATFGDTKDVRREAILPPAKVRPEAGGLEVRLASTALAGFSENMRQLVEYPYGCLEQLSSRLVPFIALREIQGKLGLAHLPAGKAAAPPGWARAWLGDDVFRLHETTDPDEVARRTVKAIERLQNADGGYRYWPTSRCSEEWVSAYAVLALGRAAELGYPVDREALRRGQGYLADTVAAGRCTRCEGTCAAPWDAERVFALQVLARTGAARASYYGELFGRRRALPLFAQAMLADAMFVGHGDRAQARAVLQEVLNHARETPAGVHFEETDALTYAPLFSSDARTTAVVLQTLADVAPDHPFVGKIAAWLANARRGDGRFRSTQEAAYALMALSEVLRTKERDVPAFTARVTLGGKAVAEVPFQGRSTDVKVASLATRDLPASSAPLPLEIRRDGKAGVLYYGAVLRYAPLDPPKDALERGLFVQRWIEPYAGGGQVRAARAGDLVRFRVRIGSAQERRYVAVEVPVPAGLEIVDTSLATTAVAAARPEPADAPEEEGWEEGEEEPEPEDAWGFRFWSPFVFEERRDDRLVLFADALPPGLHVASFVARATTPGTFALPPARAEEMYAPEVFGRSDGGTFQVIAGEAVAGR